MLVEVTRLTHEMEENSVTTLQNTITQLKQENAELSERLNAAVSIQLLFL
jgi:hypothetical protein